MHARIEQLLAIEDRSLADAVIRQHVERCAECSRELARLRGLRSNLKSLPQWKSPPIDFAVLQAELAAQPATMPPVRASYVQTEAAVTIGLLSIILLTTFTARSPTPPRVVESLPLPTPAQTEASDPSLASLVNYSQLLDRTLHEMPRRPTTERAATSATIDSLQEHIQWLDFQLSVAQDVGLNPAQAKGLWEDRVRLMNSLVAVRYAEAQRFAML
jgi:hypothetical protein